MTYLKILWVRLFKDTPAFFKKLQIFLLAISATAAVGLASIDSMPQWDWLDDAFRIGIFCGLFGTFLAQLTVQNPQEIEKK
ncbi:MAG: hypothetical protein OHK0045_21930 [Raineya sp.]